MYSIDRVDYIEDIVKSLTVDDLIEFLNVYDEAVNDVVGDGFPDMVKFFNDIYTPVKEAAEDEVVKYDKGLTELQIKQREVLNEYAGKLCKIVYDKNKEIYSETIYEVTGIAVDADLNITVDEMVNIYDETDVCNNSYSAEDLYFLSETEEAGIDY